MCGVGCLTMLSLSCAVEQVGDRSVVSQRFFGVRVLDVRWFSSETERDRLLQFCMEYGIDRLVVRVDLIAQASRDGHDAQTDSDQQPTLQYADELSKLIDQAHGHGVRVEALCDAAGMGLGDTADVGGIDLVGAVIAFNRSHGPDTQFEGIHYDITPYELRYLEKHQRVAKMHRFLEHLESIKTQLMGQSQGGGTLSVGIPHWYDEYIDGDPIGGVSYYGLDKNFHEHIQDIADYVVVMCPRQSDQENGSLGGQISSELANGAWLKRRVSVGIQTAVDPTVNKTFYGRPTWEFWKRKQDAELLLSSHEEFGGVMVDSYGAMSQLLARSPNTAEAKPALNHQTFGMWVWHEKWVKSEEAQDRLLDFCEQHGINLLPVQIHVEPGSVKRGQPKLKYPKQLHRLIGEAMRRGIKVEALDGSSEMGLEENRSSVLAILDMLLAYNKTLGAYGGFSGIHYDIEPYLLPDWKTPKRQAIMKQYLELMEAARLKIRLDAPHMALSASIPFWYDNKVSAEDSCVLEYNGQVKNFHEHIQDLTDYVAIMSYRRNALGDDSIKETIEVERAYAEWIGRYVCAGMETMPIPQHPQVSFHGLPPSEFWFQKQKLDQALDGQGGFGGVLVHSYETFMPYLSKGLGAKPKP